MVENTLTVGKISEGFVLDHIEAGKSMEIYKYLQDGTYTFSVMNDTVEMGYQAVKTLKDCINGKSGEKRIVYTEIENADKDFDFESWKAEWENRERSCMMS